MLEVLLLSLATIIFCALGAAVTWWYDNRRVANNPAPDQPTVEYLPTVACADDMFLRLGKLDFTNGNVTVVGGDGAYFALANGPKLAKLVEKIASQGAVVRYVLTSPTPATQRAIDRLGLFSTRGVEFFALGNTELAAEVKEIADRFRTTHPTLFETSKGKGLWLERNHPRNSRHAYGVSYVPPGLLSGSLLEVHAQYEKDVATLLSATTRFGPSSDEQADQRRAA